MRIKECVSVEYDKVGRVYVFNDGSRYHSVTTMLGSTSDKMSLLKWRRRVGEEEAERIGKVAAHLGEQYHLLGEYYLRGKQCVPPVNMISNHIFKYSTKPILDKHVTRVVACEKQLYSEKLKLAGRVDAVVEWDNQLSILDFKLLNNDDKKWLNDYWIQTTVYAHCWEEMYGVLPKQLVLVVGNKNTLGSVFYVSKIKPHIAKMQYRVFQFNSMLEVQ